MKRLLFIISVLIGGLSAYGQKLDAQQQQKVLNSINAATAKTRSMQCDFVQTKKMKLLKNAMQSRGVMYFASPRKLRWQYNQPYSYIFILNGEQVTIKSANTTQKIDVQRNKMFRQIADIILNSITGGNLNSSADFTVELWKNKDCYSAKLFPKKKELKKLYNVIEITFDPALTTVTAVKMEETGGDVTTVTLNNIKSNTTISESVFSIH